MDTLTGMLIDVHGGHGVGQRNLVGETCLSDSRHRKEENNECSEKDMY